MARLKSEFEVACPCCGTMLVVDTNLGRVVSHRESERGDKPELDEPALAEPELDEPELVVDEPELDGS